MRVCVDDHLFDEAKFPDDLLTWPHYFGRGVYDLAKVPEGPERDAIAALMEIPGELALDKQFVAMVQMRLTRVTDLDRIDNYDFTGKKVDRKFGELCIINWKVPIFYCAKGKRIQGFYGAYYGGVMLHELWKKHTEAPQSDKTFGDVIKHQFNSWAYGCVSMAEHEVATRTLQLQDWTKQLRHDLRVRKLITGM